MEQLIKIKNNGVSGRELFNYIYSEEKTKSNFTTWIKRHIDYYGFAEGVDFFPFSEKSTGGRPLIDYAITVNMAKELCLVSKTKIGKKTRLYFIDCEEILKKQLIRDSTKITRRDLTDRIKDSGENERMHGHAYSNYTKLIYKKLGIEHIKTKNFRDTLTPKQLQAVEGMEKMIEGYLKLGFNYLQIKEHLPDIITDIENKQIGVKR